MPTVVHAFVSADEYSDFRSVCADGSDMSPDHAVFAERVDEFINTINDQGGRAIKVHISPAELAAWCRLQSRPVDANARADYATKVFIESKRK